MRNTLASIVGVSGLGLGLGVPIYWWVTYSGVYRWLAEVQLGWFDGYYAILTGAVSLVAGFIAFLAPFGWLAARIEPPDAGAADDVPRGGDVPFKSPDALTPQQQVEREVRGGTLGCLGLLAIIIVPIVSIGIWHLVEAHQLGPKQTLDLVAVEGGAEPPSRWVEFQARPAWGEAAGIKEKYVVTQYVPVRSAPGRDAAVAVEVLAKKAQYGRSHWTGTLSRGAPGVVVSAFARNGGVREPVWVLDVDSTPDDSRRIGWSMFEVGGGMFLIGLIVIGLLRRRWRKADP